jgi:polyferredoxin
MIQIQKYFNAEKSESLLFMAFGLFFMLFSIYCYAILKDNFWKGLAIPLLFFSVIQMVIGSTIYYRSPKDKLKVENMLNNEPQKIQSEEIPRMKIVLKNFIYYRYFEIVMIAIGIVLLNYFPDYTFWKGLGIGLFVQCLLLLLLDFFAEKRGLTYLKYLQNL